MTTRYVFMLNNNLIIRPNKGFNQHLILIALIPQIQQIGKVNFILKKQFSWPLANHLLEA